MTKESIATHGTHRILFPKLYNNISEIPTDRSNNTCYPLSSITKNALTESNIQRVMGSIATHYLENPDESKKWKVQTNVETLALSAPSQPLGSSFSSLGSCCTSASPVENIVSIDPQSYVDQILASSKEAENSPLPLLYFSSLPESITNPKKATTSGHVFANTDFNANFDTLLCSEAEGKTNIFYLLNESKRKLGIDLDFHNNFPSERDVEIFHTSIANVKRQKVDSEPLGNLFLNSDEIQQKIRNFYAPPSTIDDSRANQLCRQKLPHFLEPKRDVFKPMLCSIILGDIFMDVWYNSPFPAEYVNAPKSALWICPWCLKYCSLTINAQRHKQKCHLNRPPGKEIHRQAIDDGSRLLMLFELDGSRHKLYCQNLCLLAKCFLDHKILYYDVNSFLFYVLAEYQTADDRQHGAMRIVGYFSKERNADVHNNVSCIVIFPAYQGLRYGQYLIDFSRKIYL
ncbi:hypothetical protein DI09_69p30 [Mitosporidium daphniae]|uniref:MYST-type HAT domain-containing protein n=1 Tax=Mitosporidium daphniae TaxID=1485682 RepID=A0A098VNW1_9MICR|nr:uncharacterized protein DI09_69p30 [Mitosporidium daphniae]KGG50479.1 hypothetical protein DI09_69p30 [Mitosporidium daphniae]|eukprot:XP_013236922.1 uncharacterized protein DI09_69p30 [Mitosporidium daphniae]